MKLSKLQEHINHLIEKYGDGELWMVHPDCSNSIETGNFNNGDLFRLLRSIKKGEEALHFLFIDELTPKQQFLYDKVEELIHLIEAQSGNRINELFYKTISDELLNNINEVREKYSKLCAEEALNGDDVIDLEDFYTPVIIKTEDK